MIALLVPPSGWPGLAEMNMTGCVASCTCACTHARTRTGLCVFALFLPPGQWGTPFDSTRDYGERGDPSAGLGISAAWYLPSSQR